MDSANEIKTFSNYVSDISKFECVGHCLLPGHMYHGKEGALRLARELGYAARDFRKEDVKKHLNTVYGTVLVANCLRGHLAIPIDNREFIHEMMSILNAP